MCIYEQVFLTLLICVTYREHTLYREHILYREHSYRHLICVICICIYQQYSLNHYTKLNTLLSILRYIHMHTPTGVLIYTYAYTNRCF